METPNWQQIGSVITQRIVDNPKLKNVLPEKILKYFKVGWLLDKNNPKSQKLSEDDKTELKHTILTDKDFSLYVKECTDWLYVEHDLLLNILEPKKGQGGYYLDKYNHPMSYKGNKLLKKAGTEVKLYDAHNYENEKCEKSYKYFRKYYAKIHTRDGLKRPEPRKYQEKLEDELIKLEDVVAFFSRQSGKTITISIYLLWRAIFHKDKINIGIVANRPATAKEVLSKLKNIFLNAPIWMTPPVEAWNKTNVELAHTGTNILCDSPSSDAFRGFTISLLYCDEVAYIDKNLWDEMLDSIIPTMNSLSFKQLIYTSTANGMNHWADIVRKAREGSNGMKIVENSWREVPHYDKNGNLIPPDEYKRMMIKKYGRMFFAQTEENIFLGSSKTLVGGEALTRIEEQVNNSNTITVPQIFFNGLNVYKEVQENHQYIIGVDTSKGGDDFAINVIDITKFPFEQVADANLNVDYFVMPEYLMMLGKYYNNAYMIIENNEGSGQSVADIIYNVYSYENIYFDKKPESSSFKRYPGFRTTEKSKSIILGTLKVFLEENKLIIHSKNTLSQLYTFVRKDNGKYSAESGYKDDNIMSLAITFAPFMDAKNFDDYDGFVKDLKAETLQDSKDIREYISALDFGFSDTNDNTENCDYDYDYDSLLPPGINYQSENETEFIF